MPSADLADREGIVSVALRLACDCKLFGDCAATPGADAALHIVFKARPGHPLVAVRIDSAEVTLAIN